MSEKNRKYYVTLIIMVLSTIKTQASDLDYFSENQKLGNTCRTLALDGGGVRGIVTLTVLNELQKKLSEPLVDYFDVMAGTSTGALIVLPLNLVKNPDAEVWRPLLSVDDIIQCYDEFAPRIFSSETARPYSSLKGWFGPYYSNSGLEAVAKEFFGETHLRETMTNVIIPGVDIEGYKPIYFSSLDASIYAKNNFFMRDVAVAAGAAPTYFRPKRLYNMEGTGYSVIDGGLFANNPGVVAYTHTKQIFGYKPHDDLLISLGTGETIKSLKHKDMVSKGKLGWAKELVSLILRNQSIAADNQLKQILSHEHLSHSTPKKYYRLQGIIDPEYEALDNASLANIQGLKLAGERFANEFQEDLDEIAYRLEEIQEARYVIEDKRKEGRP
jgi:patatin-like phospholipase/acyl hydrolase